MKYSKIDPLSIANGPGIRVALFVSGCTHHCKGCFNEIAWDFNHGDNFTDSTIDYIISLMDSEYKSGLTLLGGEPFEKQNQPEVLKLVKRVREKLPSKSIWAYSGYTYEQICSYKTGADKEVTDELLSLIDVLVDGKFVLELKDLALEFRGSSNQRIIDLHKTRESGEVVLFDLHPDNRK